MSLARVIASASANENSDPLAKNVEIGPWSKMGNAKNGIEAGRRGLLCRDYHPPHYPRKRSRPLGFPAIPVSLLSILTLPMYS